MTIRAFVALEKLAAPTPNAMATGPFGSSIGTKTFRAVGVPVLRGSNLSKEVGKRLIDEDLVFIDPDLAAQFQRSQVTKGDLVFTCWGTVNQVGLIDGTSRYPKYVISNKQMKFTADTTKVSPLFLYYWFSGPEGQAQITAGSIGSSVPGFNLGQLRQMHVPLLPFNSQNAIASVLSVLDDKIDLNRRMNETLEAIAWAIFKDWFVDFGPTRKKIEGGAPYLAPEIWALFPDRFDGEGKPEGWAERPLDQIAEFLNGLALQKYPADGGSYLPVIKIAQLRAGNSDASDRASEKIPAAYVVEDGDVLFSWSGSLLHRVWTAGRGALNQHLFKVTSTQYPKWFFFHWIGHHLLDFQATAASKATTMGHIQRHHLTQAKTIVPDKSVMDIANEIVGPIFERGIKNDLETRTLAAVRDLLLPKLMSGEIRIKEAAKIAEAAL